MSLCHLYNKIKVPITWYSECLQTVILQKCVRTTGRHTTDEPTSRADGNSACARHQSDAPQRGDLHGFVIRDQVRYRVGAQLATERVEDEREKGCGEQGPDRSDHGED